MEFVNEYDPAVMAALGVIIPMLVGFVTKTSTSAKLKGWLCAGVSVIAGAIMVFVSGGFDGGLAGDAQTITNQLISYIAIIAVAAQTNYSMWIKPSGVSAKLQADFGIKDIPLPLIVDAPVDATDEDYNYGVD